MTKKCDIVTTEVTITAGKHKYHDNKFDIEL